MAPPSQKVLNWLHNVLRSDYRFVDRTYADVAQALNFHPWISLRTEVYTFENGSSTLLLNLSGSLPVSFRGTTYGFPVVIWIPREYPQASAISLLIPQKDMMIRPGQHVSGEGRIYHPYLANWDQNRSSIRELIAIFQDIFSKEPPVVARPHQPPAPPLASPPGRQQLQQHNGVPPAVPPLPPELNRPHQQKAQSGSSMTTNGPPPLPPKPMETSRADEFRPGRSPPPAPPNPTFQALQRSQPNAGDNQVWNAQYSSTPVNTTTGPDWSARPSYGAQSPVAQSYPGTFQNRGQPIPQLSNAYTPHHPPQQPYIQQQQGQAIPQQRPPHQLPPDIQPHSPIQYSDQRFPQPNIGSQVQRQPQSYNANPTRPKPAEDLLTSPLEIPLSIESRNVAPPPIPPNPQKDALLSSISQILSEEVRSIHGSTLAAINPLQAQQSAIANTIRAVQLEIAQLNDLEALLSSNEALLHQATREADQVLEDAKRRQVPGVDDVLIAPSVVSRQLYEAVTEERAIEDCRNVLAKALDKGRISSNTWAKQTRGLAREEFLKKALVKKISNGMNLVEDDPYG